MNKKDTKWWKKHYSENSDQIKVKAKINYQAMPEDVKRAFLDKLKEKRANETPGQREERLRKAKERYQSQRDQRLKYQKEYNTNKKAKTEILENKVKKLEKKLKKFTEDV